MKSTSLDSKNKRQEVPQTIRNLTTKNNIKSTSLKNILKESKIQSLKQNESGKKALLNKKLSDISLLEINKPKNPLLLKNRQRPSQSLHIKYNNNLPIKPLMKI